MGIPTIPTRHQDEAAHRQRIAESINSIRDFTFDDSRVRTQAEIDAGLMPVNYAYSVWPMYDARRMGTVGDGVADDTQAIKNAYAACAAGGYRLFLPRGTYLVVLQLLWDQKVDVIGESREDTVILAAGDFYAIRIDQNGQESLYENFTVDRASGVAGGTGGGIDIYLGNRITLRRIKAIDQTGHGILLRAGNLGTYDDIIVRNNSEDGFSIASGTGEDPNNSAWACRFTNIDAIGNGGWGMNFDIGNSHFGMGLICQNNLTGGLRVNANTNVLQVYAENNAGNDVNLTSSSVRNFLTTNNIDSTASIIDDGSDNVILDVALYPLLQVERLMPLPRSTNVAGRDQYVIGGFGGLGAAGVAGGKAIIQGGEAQGTAGAAAGGDVELEGGNGVNSGAKGAVVAKNALVQARLGVPYSASITFNANTATQFQISANNGTAFTINAPTNPREGQFIVVTIRNTSGGALGAVTWNAVFKMAAWTQPANGFSRSVTFMYDGASWLEVGRTSADVPN